VNRDFNAIHTQRANSRDPAQSCYYCGSVGDYLKAAFTGCGDDLISKSINGQIVVQRTSVPTETQPNEHQVTVKDPATPENTDNLLPILALTPDHDPRSGSDLRPETPDISDVTQDSLCVISGARILDTAVESVKSQRRRVSRREVAALGEYNGLPRCARLARGPLLDRDSTRI
jgi:hypothetical protein